MKAGRRWPLLVIAAVLALALVALGVVVVWRGTGTTCTPEPRVGARNVPPVFDTGRRPARSDARLARLVRAARAWGLGRVIGAVGFDYGHFLSVAPLPDGLAAWTKDNPDVAFLDSSLRPRWAIAQDKGQHAWDLTVDRWFQLRLPSRSPMEVTARRLSDGEEEWCSPVGSTPTRFGDPLATAALPGGDVIVLANDAAGSLVTRLAARDGRGRWSRSLDGGRDGSALVGFGPVVVTGGRASYDLAGSSADTLTALDAQTGRTAWTWSASGPVHVLGTAGARLLLEEQRPSGLRLVALDQRGHAMWSRPAPAGALPDAAVRDGTAVLRTPDALYGWSAATGSSRWRTPVRTHQQPFPYGFQLDAQPMLDSRRLLLGGTTALLAVDLRTGKSRSFPLPVHGIDTAYWPYQVVVTDRLLAVVTNTGGLVLRR